MLVRVCSLLFAVCRCVGSCCCLRAVVVNRCLFLVCVDRCLLSFDLGVVRGWLSSCAVSCVLCVIVCCLLWFVAGAGRCALFVVRRLALFAAVCWCMLMFVAVCGWLLVVVCCVWAVSCCLLSFVVCVRCMLVGRCVLFVVVW